MPRTAAAPLHNGPAVLLAILLSLLSGLVAGCHDHDDDSSAAGGAGGTGDTTPPTVLFFAPDANAENVSVLASIRARFSEAMDEESVDSTSFIVESPAGPLVGAVTLDTVADTATFTPATPLPDGVPLTARLTTDIADAAGNTLDATQEWTFRTENLDLESPTVVQTAPSDGTAAVAVGAPITATFSEALDPSTINVASFMLLNAGTPIAGFVTYDPDSLTASFAPAAPLPSSTSINGSLTQGIRDLAGNPLDVPVSFTFDTEAIDTTPPMITSTTPGDQDTDVSVTTDIQVTFSEALDPSTVVGTNFTLTAPGAAIAGSVNYDPTTLTARFTPNVPLPIDTTLRVDVLMGITDLAGNSLTGSRIWTFTTAPGDTTPPSVTSVSPADQQAGVAQNGMITATFSEAMDATTIDAATFILSAGGSNIPGLVDYDPGTQTATLAPGVSLPPNSVIMARLTAVIADESGNRLEQPFEWSFTTVSVDNTAPTVTAISPNDLDADVSTGVIVAATFSEAIDVSTLTPSSFRLSANNVLIPGTLTYDSGTFTANYRPDVPLPTGTIVRADVRTSVTDLAGNPLDAQRIWTFTTEAGDTTAPTVASTFPTAGATDVPLGGLVTATFSEQVDPATINVASFMLTVGGVPLAGFVTYDTASFTATFSPAAALPQNSNINLVLGQGIMDLAGNRLAAPVQVSFSTEAFDVTPPTIAIISPSDLLTGVPVGTAVRAVFSEALNPGTVDVGSFLVSNAGAPISGTVTYDALTFTATFEPSAPYPISTTLRVDLLPSITDRVGNALVGPQISTFTTESGDTTPPSVVQVDPADLSMNVSLSGLISAQFSENIDPATLTPGTFVLTSSGAPVAGALSYDASTLTATFAPSSPLPPNATIDGRLTTVIADLAGNRLDAPISWSFATVSVDNVPPAIVLVSPADLETNVPVGSEVTATFSEAIDAASLTPTSFEVSVGGVPVMGTLSYDSSSLRASFTPSVPLPVSTVIRADIRTGVRDLSGNALAAPQVWTFSTEAGDTTPPAIVSTSPTAGTIDFPLGGLISATFSEPLDPATVNAGSFQLLDGATPIAGIVTYDPVGLSASFAPTASLPSSSSLTVRLTQGLRDMAGNALAATFQFGFTTEAIDTSPPTVVAVSPPDLASGVPVSSSVSATFSEAIDASSLTAAALRLTANNIALSGSVSYDPTTFTATLTPSAPLPSAQTIRADLESTVTDLAGNPLAAPLTWTFSTALGDTTPPTLVATQPLPGATGVPVGGMITATFSEALDPTTVNAGSFVLTSAGAPLAGFVGYDAATLTSTFVPVTPLPAGTVIDVEITQGIRDAAGNPLASSTQFSFTTEVLDTSPPLIVATDPADNATGVQPTSSVTATFSEALDPVTVNASTFLVSNAGAMIPGTVVYDPATFQVRFSANAPLPSNTNLRVDVATMVSDLAGNGLAGPAIWTFTTDPGDITPPTVTSFSPANLATDVPVGSVINATFSEALDPTTLTPGTFSVEASGAPLAGTVAFNAATRTAEFTPSAPLPSSSTITVRLSTLIADAAGNRLASPLQWSFDTIFVDSTPPTVVGISPADGSVQVPLDAVVAVTFSEEIEPATLNQFVVTTSGGPVPGNVTYDPSLLRATFTPSAPLPGATDVQAEARMGITDLAGNPLAMGRTWSFTTFAGDITPPSVVSVSPADLEDTVGLRRPIEVVFSEALDPTTVSPSAFTVEANGALVGGTLNYDPAGPSITFVPADGLPGAATVDVLVMSSITDVAGNALVSNVGFSFSTPFPRYVYSANSTSDNVAIYRIDSESGRIDSRGYAPAGSFPAAVSVDPLRRFAYVANSFSDDVSGYAVDPVTGALSSIGRTLSGGQYPSALVVEPTGRFLYVVNEDSRDVSMFAINASSGVLSVIAPPVSTFVGGPVGPREITTDHEGRFAYVVNTDTNNVTTFSIDQITGVLVRVGPRVDCGQTPLDIAVDPSDRFAYVVNGFSDDVTAFAIDPLTGTLARIGTDISVGNNPQSLDVDPTGRFVFVCNAGPAQVTTLEIDPTTGALSQVGSPISAPSSFEDLRVDPSGRYVHVASFSDTVTTYAIDPTNGTLTFSGLVRTPTGNTSLDYAPGGAAPVTPVALSVYTANFGSNDVANFSVDQATGLLTQVGTTALAGGEPRAVALDPSGRFAYAANSSTNDVSAYRVQAADGSLTVISGAMPAGTTPRDLVVDPSGRFLYVANGESNDVTTFSIDGSTGAITEVGSAIPTGGINPRSLSLDLAGEILFVANADSNNVSRFRVDRVTGALSSAGSPFAASDEPQDVRVHPSGRFVYVVNEVSDDVTTFSLGTFAGSLTEVGSEVSAGNGPRAIAFDPSGRFAYVVNENSNNVTQFTVDQDDGSLTQFGTSPMAGIRPIDIAVDRSGRFAYVADFTSSTVTTFEIDPVSGALTQVGTSTPGTNTRGVAIRSRDQ